jgi:transposase
MNTQKKIEPKDGVIKIAVDMHLKSYRVVRQTDHTAPQPAQKFTPEAFYTWLRSQFDLAERVVVCYEAGCFGYEPARRMQAMGVEVLVIAPQSWDEQGKRQVNDTSDAQVMCRRLSEYLNGHKRALSVVRIPTREEEAKRAEARLREQLRKQIRRMQAMGRSLLLSQGLPMRGHWWIGRKWLRIQKETPAWVQTQLTVWKELIQTADKQARRLEAQLRAAAGPGLLFGEGQLSHELVRRELIDAHRFRNGRQVGNYFGLCPSESTTSDRRRLGSITKHGNPRLRQVMIEMAWRVAILQPKYRAVQKFLPVLEDKKASSGSRKKAIVAVARRLAVDLWRIATGRVRPEELGLRLA